MNSEAIMHVDFPFAHNRRSFLNKSVGGMGLLAMAHLLQQSRAGAALRENRHAHHPPSADAVIDDELSVSDRLTFLINSGAPAPAVWAEMGIASETVDEWKQMQADSINQQEQMLAARVDNLANKGANNGG